MSRIIREISEIRGCNMQAMAAYLAGQSDVVVAYLFGSVARGRARPGSDVDVAVLVDDAVDGDPHLVAREGFRYPENNKDVFRVLI